MIAGWSSPVARKAHNLEVVGSNPTPATSPLFRGGLPDPVFFLSAQAIDTRLWIGGARRSPASPGFPDGSETMAHKKADDKPPARSGLSVASLLLGITLRATLPAPLPQEPSGNRKPKGKNRAKRHN